MKVVEIGKRKENTKKGKGGEAKTRGEGEIVDTELVRREIIRTQGVCWVRKGK